MDTKPWKTSMLSSLPAPFLCYNTRKIRAGMKNGSSLPGFFLLSKINLKQL